MDQEIVALHWLSGVALCCLTARHALLVGKKEKEKEEEEGKKGKERKAKKAPQRKAEFNRLRHFNGGSRDRRGQNRSHTPG